MVLFHIFSEEHSITRLTHNSQWCHWSLFTSKLEKRCEKVFFLFYFSKEIIFLPKLISTLYNYRYKMSTIKWFMALGNYLWKWNSKNPRIPSVISSLDRIGCIDWYAKYLNLAFFTDESDIPMSSLTLNGISSTPVGTYNGRVEY